MDESAGVKWDSLCAPAITHCRFSLAAKAKTSAKLGLIPSKTHLLWCLQIVHAPKTIIEFSPILTRPEVAISVISHHHQRRLLLVEQQVCEDRPVLAWGTKTGTKTHMRLGGDRCSHPLYHKAGTCPDVVDHVEQGCNTPCYRNPNWSH
jgi:hypothetical protein